MQVTLNKEFEKYIDQSKYKNDLRQVMNYVVSLINENHLYPNDLEIQILGNHLSEMVNRAEKGEKLEPVDEKIFAKVRKQSLDMAQQIIDFILKNIGPLADSEKYVLSIHFENMISN